MEKKTGLIALLAVAVLIGSGLLFSVYPIDNQAFQGQPFHIRFYSGTYEISHSGTCPANPQTGQAFLIQTVKTTDDNTGEVWDTAIRNGQPSCTAQSYQWPDVTFTPLYAHHYTMVSTVKDGTTDYILHTDTWPFQVQPASAPVCTSGQKRCDFQSDPDRIQICGTEGQYSQWGEFCPGGCVEDNAGGAHCAQVCTPGSYRCTTEVQYQTCNNDGISWGDYAICPYTFPLPTRCVEGGSDPCVQASPVCGDGICSLGEATTCSQDCGTMCGNGVCDSGETAQSCRADCDVCWQNPQTMPLEQLCQCFPSSPQCQSVAEPGDLMIWLLGGGGALVIIVLVVYLATRKR